MTHVTVSDAGDHGESTGEAGAAAQAAHYAESHAEEHADDAEEHADDAEESAETAEDHAETAEESAETAEEAQQAVETSEGRIIAAIDSLPDRIANAINQSVNNDNYYSEDYDTDSGEIPDTSYVTDPEPETPPSESHWYFRDLRRNRR